MPCLIELGIRKGGQLTAYGLKSLFSGSSLKELTCMDLSECSDLTDEVIQVMCDWWVIKCMFFNITHIMFITYICPVYGIT